MNRAETYVNRLRSELAESRAQVEQLREALHDIQLQATRKDRATDEREYLLRDLAFIAEKVRRTLDVVPLPEKPQP